MSNPVTIAERIIGKALTDQAVIDELKAVDAGAKPEGDADSLFWCSEPAGFEVSADPSSQRTKTVIMFAEGSDDYEQFAGDLPGGIGFDWDRARIVSHMGKPVMTGPEHDRWEFDDYAVVVSYDDAGRVADVALTTE